MSAQEFKKTVPAPPPAAKQLPEANTLIIDRRPVSGAETAFKDGASPYIISRPNGAFPPVVSRAPAPVQERIESYSPGGKANEGFRLIGEAMKTYVLAETADALLIIDKHAVHERMLFDKLRKKGYDILSQQLIVPVTVKLTAGDVELVEENRGDLERLGIELEPFGDDSLILRALPEGADAGDAPALIEELCQKLREGHALSPETRLDGIQKTIACKAAIKAGQSSSAPELEEIVRRVVSGEISCCPHGRPVLVTLSKTRLDKDFSRIV
jgi:DNA mismatch repair protein MutL